MMKKLLSILTVIGLSTTVSTAVVACGNQPNKREKEKIIQIDEYPAELKVNETELIEIKNYLDLKNVQIKVNENLVLVKEVDEHHQFQIQTVKVGEGKITITADNAETLEITFEVKNEAVKNIRDILTADDLELGVVKNKEKAWWDARLVIWGISELAGKVILNSPNNGQIHVIPVKGSDLTGTADFNYQLKIDILQKIDIEKYLFLPIRNASELTGLVVKSNNKNVNVKIAKVNNHIGVEFYGVNAGLAEVTVSAEYAQSTTIAVTIK